jgi:hypothetical protein
MGAAMKLVQETINSSSQKLISDIAASTKSSSDVKTTETSVLDSIGDTIKSVVASWTGMLTSLGSMTVIAVIIIFALLVYLVSTGKLDSLLEAGADIAKTQAGVPATASVAAPVA